MKTKHLLSLALLLVSLVSAEAAKQRSPFGITAGRNQIAGETVARFSFTVPPDCVLYAERLHFETADGTALTPANIPVPVPHLDKATGREKPVYAESFTADLNLGAAFTGNLIVKFQGCSNTACFFPEQRVFAAGANGQFAEVTAGAPAVAAANTGEVLGGTVKKFKVVGQQTGYMKSGEFLAFLDASAKGQAADDPLAKFKKAGMVLTLLLIVLGGLGLNLTPCVLPLIPINLAIIGAGSQAKSRGRGFLNGAVYGAGMALVYGVLGLVVVLTGSKFGALNSSVWFNVGIALVFVVMALAMFDVISLDFSRFSSGISAGGGQSKSITLVAFTLGAVAALLAGACVAPVVISVLLLSTDLYSKGMVIGLGLPFLLGFGMALPWPFAGASLAFLPKPGKWMAKVKYGFGVLIVLFAFYYGHTAYGLLKSSRASTALAGAPGGANAATPKADANQTLTRALAQAQAEGKSVFVDFKASWCKNCLAMDETVFNQPDVLKQLENFIVVKYEAERPNESPAREVLDKFNVLGLPTYVVLTPTKND
ncbi:MAG: thioredoxin family protein [Verrucomicrobia bacterium]|nr:thioredoxin family protein [Verrucomicrobiota bacterium]